MSYNYTLKYRTFDTLVNDAFSDFEKYYQSGLIKPHQLIKVALRCNYELGLRIYQTYEEVLEVEKGRVRLPDNFYVFNYAFICGDFEIRTPLPQGTNLEQRILGVPEYRPAPPVPDGSCYSEPAPPDPCCNTCDQSSPCNCNSDSCTPRPSVCMNCKGEEWELVQVINYQTRVYKNFYPLKLVDSARSIECDCPNLYFDTHNKAWIKDEWLYTNFESGKVYLNYQGMLQDEEGNLLVPDHPLLNEYYEYSMKQRILENLIMNDEPVSQIKIQLIEQRWKPARNAALSLVRMPNFGELRKVYEANRKAQYSKYFDMFSGFDGFTYTSDLYSKAFGNIRR